MARSAHSALETSGSDGVAVVQMDASQSIAFRKRMVVVQDEAAAVRLWHTLYQFGNGQSIRIGLADVYTVESFVQKPDDKRSLARHEAGQGDSYAKHD